MKSKEIFNLFKNKHIQTLGIIFIIGVVFMLAFGTKTTDKKQKEETVAVNTQTDEERLSGILSQIKGAGEVSVMITYYGTSEKNLAYETKTSSTSDEGRNGENTEKNAVLTKDEPMVVKETYPEVKGVIITAEGADSAYVRQAITEGTAAVLDVPAHRICIYKKED